MNVIVFIFIVPILTVCSIGLGICSVIAVAGGFLQAFHIGGLGMEFLPGKYLSPWVSLPVSLVFAFSLLIISILCCKSLRRCLTLTD